MRSFGSFNYALAKELNSVLAPFSYSNRTVKDTFEFVNLINNTNFDCHVTMCSFDVVSLFTNVPLNQTIHIACEKVFAKQDKVLGLDQDW